MGASSALAEVVEVIQLPADQRQPEQLERCGAYFRQLKFFRAGSEGMDECVKHMMLEVFGENQPVFLAGDKCDRLYFVLTGSVRIVSGGLTIGSLEPGESIAEGAVLGRTAEEQKHTETVIADEEGTKLATLSRSHYLHASGGFAAVVRQILKSPPMRRSQADTGLLTSRFEATDFFRSLHFGVLQRKCCQCMTPVAFRRGQKLEVRPEQWFLCIVVSGTLTISKDRKAVRTLKENDTLMGEGVVANGEVLTASAEGLMAVLTKQNYAAVTSDAVAQIKEVLSRPPQKRSKKELEFSMQIFCDGSKTLPFFRALPSAVIRKNSCKMLGCREFARGTTVFFEGDSADCLYIIINGAVVLNGTLTKGHDLWMTAGSEFGHFDGRGGVTTDKVEGIKILNHRTATAKVDSDICVVATLDKADFTRLCQLDEIHVWMDRFWKLITTKEPSNDDELRAMFDELDTDSSGELDRSEICTLLDSLGRRPTEDQLDILMARMDPDSSGEVDFAEFSAWYWVENATARSSTTAAEPPNRELHAAFQSVDADGSGVVDYDELREGLHKLQVATSADDESAIQVLLTEFDADGSGALDFEEFSALVKKLQDGQSKLAQLDSKSAPSSIKFIKFEHYKLLHSRIAASIMPDFTEEEAETSSRSDWQEDLQRFGNKDEQLDQQQFGHAMFQLVDEWCNGASSTQMIVGWLRMLFSNIVGLSGNLKTVSDVGCIDDELTNMADMQRKSDNIAKKEAEARFKKNAAEVKAKEKEESAAQAKTEKARRAKESKEKKERLKAKKAEQAAKKKAKKAEKAAKDTTETMTKAKKAEKAAKDTTETMRSLADEEAELMRRLQSGELSPEEEAAVRTRLVAIEAERESLLAAAAADRDAQLSALADEEAELLRRLESGELTAEEEVEVRRRLKAIAAERAAVHAAYSTKVPNNSHLTPAESAQLASQLKRFGEALSALDDEEAKLLRRLASGELSAEEEAAVRARLKEIGEERRAIEQARYAALEAAGQTEMMGMDRKTAQLAAELLAVDGKLSELDDEEAELMRRLASGELSPEEELAVKARLAEIASEREKLLEQRQSVLQAQRDLKQQQAEELRIHNTAQRKKAAASLNLAALDDEEAELRRKLASGKLTLAERAAVMARLEDIAAERAAITNAAQAADKSSAIALEIAQLDRHLSKLDDEVAELMRRLESGECTAEEEAVIRARLEAIEAERAELTAQRQSLVEKQEQAAAASRQARLEMQVSQIKSQLTALDNEEAELLRRLAMGDLSAEEDAQIRARLRAIVQERENLQGRLKSKEDALRRECRHTNATDQVEGKVTVAEPLSPKSGCNTVQTTADQVATTQSTLGVEGNPRSNAQDEHDSRRMLQVEEAAAKEARRALRKECRRKEAILNAARASARRMDIAGSSSVSMNMNANRDIKSVGHCKIRPSEWYRWTDTASKLRKVATEYDQQSTDSLSNSEHQPLEEPEFEHPRSKLEQQEPTRRRRRLPRVSQLASCQTELMRQAKVERRHNAVQYIASKIADETKARVAKGFTLPALSLHQSISDQSLSSYVPLTFGHPSSAVEARRMRKRGARAPSVPICFTQRRPWEDGLAHSSPRTEGAGEHPFDTAYAQRRENVSARNPNLNMGRSARRSPGGGFGSVSTSW